MLSDNNNQTKLNSSVDSVDMLSISRNIDEFKCLDNENKGYLDENQAKSYFKSQCSSQKSFDSIMHASFDQTSQIGLEKFLIITHLLRLNINDDSASNTKNDEAALSPRFSNLLRHCEESLKQVEKDRKNSSTLLSASKVKLSAAMEQLEICWKELLQHDTGVTSKSHDADIHSNLLHSTDKEEHKKQSGAENDANNSSPSSHQNIAPISGTPDEVMPGSFDFDNMEDSKNEDRSSASASNAASMTDLPPVAPPRKSAMLSIDSEGKIVPITEAFNSESKPVYEKEPNLSNSLSFTSQTPPYKETAKERSMPSSNIITSLASDESRPMFPQRTSTMNSLNSVEADSSAVSDDDMKKEMEVFKDEDDIGEPSSSIAKDVIVPIAPTTVIPSRAVEDPIIESNDDPIAFGSSVPQHPMVRAELFSNPSFYSCSSYRSTDDNNTSNVVSAQETPQNNNGTSKQSIDHDYQQFSASSAMDTNNNANEKEAPQITVPVTKSPILSDAQFTSLTGVGKPVLPDNSQSRRADEKINDLPANNDSDNNLNTVTESIQNGNNLSNSSRQMSPGHSNENHISVLPLLAIPAASGLPLNKIISQDAPSDNTSEFSDVASGAISPPPSRSDVKQSMVNSSSLGPVENAENIESSTIKEPLYQSADAAVPGGNEITDSLDKKLDLIIEDDPNVINESLQPNDINPQQDSLLSTHGLPMANNKRHSVISTESRFIELDNDHISPLMKNVRSMDSNSDDLHHGEAPQVPSHRSVNLPPSPASMSSEPHNKTANRLSMYTDHTAAKAIQDTFDLLATPSGNNKEERVLKVRKGFGGFRGLGIECVHDDANQV